MTNINIHDLDTQSVPFFVRYLEGRSNQLTEEEVNAVRGGTELILGVCTAIGQDALTLKGSTICTDDLLMQLRTL